MLIATKIKVNNTDITPYIAHKGVQWSRHDVDGPSTGRALSGLMIRDRIATKIRLDITCRPLKIDELRTLLNLLLPVFVTVEYDDPMYGHVTKTMYANNNSATFLFPRPPEMENGTEYWTDIKFPLVER